MIDFTVKFIKNYYGLHNEKAVNNNFLISCYKDIFKDSKFNIITNKSINKLDIIKKVGDLQEQLKNLPEWDKDNKFLFQIIEESKTCLNYCIKHFEDEYLLGE